ncbi:hypothetical protein NDU88_006039 [Pleurodeles waltl]|uniref:Uncharacterized protein n=1 Tax=Pleurodeles waltl TaxID=8319 RepID=A0AAV7MCY2_PLEWA|nr:hypothetical protein NDU88_006039 [Pleurodeles waltl]
MLITEDGLAASLHMVKRQRYQTLQWQAHTPLLLASRTLRLETAIRACRRRNPCGVSNQATDLEFSHALPDAVILLAHMKVASLTKQQ